MAEENDDIVPEATPFQGWPRWLVMTGSAVAGFVALAGASQYVPDALSPATKQYVQNQLQPIQRVGQQSLRFEIIMLQQQLTRLDMAIQSGQASDNDRTLAETIRATLCEDKTLLNQSCD